jgi:tetratricopeptide (TPR) repeat protein
MTAAADDLGAYELGADDLVEVARELEADGQLQDAATYWGRAAAARPGDDAILRALTGVLVRLARAGEAVEACRRAVAGGSVSTYPWRERAVISYVYLNDPAGAAESLREALASHPHDAQAHLLMATLAYQTQDFDLAREHGQRALETADDDVALQVRQRILGDFEGAVSVGRRLLLQRPTDVDVLVLCGLSLHLMGRLDEAVGFYYRAAEHAPYRGDVIFPLADALILLGDHRAGWRRFGAVGDEAMLRTNLPAATPYLDRFWRGEPLAGKRIFILPYVGLGDSLMYARYARDLKAAGAHVTWCCRPELQRLFADLGGSDVVTSDGQLEALGDYDHWCLDLLLPGRFGAGEGRIPTWPEGYLKVPAETGAISLPDRGNGRLQVGLCWKTSPSHYLRNARSLSPEDLRPLARIADVDWHVLQKWPVEPDFAARSGLAIRDTSHEWADFHDSAVFAGGLDLTISICSAPVHLAGALGLPAWAMIADPPEWRWGRQGDRAPWYPQARVFRQTARGDWLSVTEAVARAFETERGALEAQRTRL